MKRRTRPVSERFWSKVEKTDTCWLWQAGTNGTGYGSFVIEGKRHYAHRWAYEQLVGSIPAGLQLDHLCRVRMCVNPAHLEPVTQRENLLRGCTVVSMNSQKTQCVKGHDFAEKLNRHGHRECVTCRRLRDKGYYARNRDKRLAYSAQAYAKRQAVSDGLNTRALGADRERAS